MGFCDHPKACNWVQCLAQGVRRSIELYQHVFVRLPTSRCYSVGTERQESAKLTPHAGQHLKFIIA